MYSIQNYIANIPVTQYIAQYRNASKFIEFCKQCPKYSNSWACPPFLFDSDKYPSSYNIAYLLGTKITLPKSFHSSMFGSDELIKQTEEIIRIVRLELDQQLLSAEQQIKNSKAFFAGSCLFCFNKECTRVLGEPCRYPEKIRPSLESLGFDIGKTTEELLGIELQWNTINHQPEYITLVSGLFCQSSIENIKIYFPNTKLL